MGGHLSVPDILTFLVLGAGSLSFTDRGIQRHFVPSKLCQELEKSEEDFIWHTWSYLHNWGLVIRGHLRVIEGRIARKGRMLHWGHFKESLGMWGERMLTQRGCKWVTSAACSLALAE